MAELTEQQQHLQNVVSQQNQLVAEINELGAQADAKRQQAVKLQGIMEYLSELGVTLPEPEVVEEEAEVAQLPPNPEMLTARMDELREEIGQITNVINANQKQLDTYVAAFNWYSQQLEAATAEQE